MAGGNGYLKAVDSGPLLMPLPLGATLGRVGGHSRVALYGHTPTPTANTDCWEGAAAYPFQTVASVLEILSSSASDAAAGTGARSMMVQGLDLNFNPLSEVVVMNGTTPVQTVNSYLRVNGLNISTSGSGHVNAGDITLRLTGAGATQAIARAGYGYAKQCLYTVPAGFTLLTTDVLPECGGTSAATGIVFAFMRVSPTLQIQITNEYTTNPGNPVQRSIITGAVVPSTYAVVMHLSRLNGAPTEGFCSLNGILVDNTQLV
jgi:hypothetical protein